MVLRFIICFLLISYPTYKCNPYGHQHYSEYYDDSSEDSKHDCDHHDHNSHLARSPNAASLQISLNIPTLQSHPSTSHHVTSRTEDTKPNHHEARSIDRHKTANTFIKEDRVSETDNESAVVSSHVQIAQEQERRRLLTRVVEPKDRTENGTYKIVNHPSGLANRRGAVDDSGGILFPDSINTRSAALNLVPEVPEECRKMGICEDVPNYPKEHVDMLLKNLGPEKLKLKVDEADIEIAQRFGPPDEQKLCDDIVRVMIPQAAPDKTGRWYYILNQKEAPLQGFHVSICRQDRSPCSTNVATYRSGYTATCKQNYVLRYLASVAENGTLVQRFFKLPSCCSCVVKKEF